MIRRTRSIRSLAALVALLGCTGHTSPARSTDPQTRRAELLQHELAILAENAAPSESWLLAETALRQSQSLAAEYHLTRPPILHNFLVNLGLRERGLCWHWTQDMLGSLRKLSLPSYQLHWGVAHRGRLFREHNSVIVTARGRDLTSGLVLDPWRRSGELYWTAVGSDSYPWEPH